MRSYIYMTGACSDIKDSAEIRDLQQDSWWRVNWFHWGRTQDSTFVGMRRLKLASSGDELGKHCV